MKYHKKGGFALPSVLIASVIMMTVLVASVSSVAALRASISAQYYNQLAKSASDAGVAYAKSCIQANAGAVTWSDTNKLGPNTDCSGIQLSGFTCPDNSLDERCSVFVGNNIITTFSVGLPTFDASGVITKITANGIVELVRDSDVATWRTYNQTSQLAISNPTALNSTANISVLVVAGGGGGGSGVDFAANGGGGGAGGVAYYDSYRIGVGSYSVVVGNGGGANNNGQNSSFGPITAIGGGRGGSQSLIAGNGGSGGGGATTNTIGSSGTPGQGYDGANMNTASPYQGGGGGGGSELGNTDGLGHGGDGFQTGISGALAYYGGGGGGGADGSAGIGGTGGGGNGVIYTDTRGGYPGTANTGGGGGGGASRTISAPGGAGGSGIVIVSYPTGSITATGGTITTIGGRTIHTFTSGTSSFTVTSIGTWSYRRDIKISNPNTYIMNDYQVQIAPFTDNNLLNNTGLIGSWHFNDFSSGSIANGATNGLFDMSGVGNHMVATNANGTGMSYSAGKFGGAAYFDGTDDYLTSMNNIGISSSSLRTFEFWFKPSDKQGRQDLFSFGSTAVGQMFNLLYDFNTDEGLFFGGYLTDQGGSPNTITRNAWNYVVVTYDGTTARVYINGNTTPDITFACALNTTDTTLLIGKSKENVGYFNGSIDEFRVYNRAFSTIEVANRYGNFGTPKIRGDYGDIRFTDSTGTKQYSYWQEADNKFWVKIPSLTPGESTIRMYYGNPIAASASNGNDTFAFFDDFNRMSIDNSKWIEIDPNNEMTQANGSLTLSAATSVWDSAWISRTRFNRTPGLVIGGAFKASSSVAAPNHVFVGWDFNQDTNPSFDQLAHGIYFNYGTFSHIYENGVSYAASGASYAPYSYNLFNIRLKSTGADYYNNNNLVYTGAGGSISSSPLRVAICQYSHTGNIYYIYVRQGSPTEPTNTAPGTEVNLSNYVSL